MNSGFSHWLLKLAGFDPDSVPDGSDWVFGFTNMPESWGAFVLLALVLLGIYLIVHFYAREMKSCPFPVKLLLAAVRTVVLLVLVLVLLGPSIIYSQHRTIHPLLAVLRDSSQSISRTDEYRQPAAIDPVAKLLKKSPAQLQQDPPTRASLVEAMMAEKDGAFLKTLREVGNVRLVDFADADAVEVRKTWPAAASAGSEESGQPESETDSAEKQDDSIPPLEAIGRGTDIAFAVRQALEDGPPDAVVLFTDGRHTGADDPRQAADQARQQGVPLLIVGLGDPTPTRNVSLASVYVRPRVWPNEPFEIEAVLTADLQDAQEVGLELLESRISSSDGQPGPPRVVSRESVEIPAGGSRVQHTFSHQASEPGKYIYIVQAQALPDEPADDNRNQSEEVEVLDRDKQNMRVLLIAGAPSWEYWLVSKLLERDKTIETSCWLQSLDVDLAQQGDRQIDSLPVTADELFEYDVILMFDPNPSEFDENWIDLLKRFVGEHSGGLLYMAGPKYSVHFLSGRTGDMRRLLPVRFGDVAVAEAGLLGGSRQNWPLQIVNANVDHPIMSFFHDRQSSLARWESLPGVYWSFPAIEPTPTSQVLIEHSDPTLGASEGARPLLAAGRYGSGHTVYMGFGGTWRWRSAGRQAEFFDRFWVQVVRYLGEARPQAGQRRGTVQTDREHYEIGDSIVVTARLRDAAYEPLTADKVEASLKTGDGQVVTFPLPKAGRDGVYETTLTARSTGQHEIRILFGEGIAGAPNPVSFEVKPPSIEANRPWLDEALLRDMAARSGGKYFHVDQGEELLASITAQPDTIEVPGKTDPLWDVRGLIFLVVCLLSFEWAVRKWYKLL